MRHTKRMSDDFDKLTSKQLTELQLKIQKATEVINEARSLKSRSLTCLNGFLDEVNRLSVLKLVARRDRGDREAKWEFVFNAPGGSHSNRTADAFLHIMYQISSSFHDKPFGFVPMEQFWSEWTKAVADLTKLMVSRYTAKYVDTIPTDTAENARAFLVSKTVEESAQPTK